MRTERSTTSLSQLKDSLSLVVMRTMIGSAGGGGWSDEGLRRAVLKYPIESPLSIFGRGYLPFLLSMFTLFAGHRASFQAHCFGVLGMGPCIL